MIISYHLLWNVFLWNSTVLSSLSHLLLSKDHKDDNVPRCKSRVQSSLAHLLMSKDDNVPR